MAAVREFSNGWVECAPGALGSILDGAWTMAAVVRASADAEWQTILSLENGGSFCSFEVAPTAGGELFVYIDGVESYGGAVVFDEWLFVAVTKPAGTNIPRMHVYRYSTGTWVRGDGDDPLGDFPAPVQIVAFGAWERTQDPWDGRIAAVAIWDAALTDQQLDGLTARLDDWLTSGAVAVWPLGTDPVVDATGGGADQTGSSGTTVVDDPTLPFDPSPSSGDDHQGAGASTGLLLTAGPGTGVPAVIGSGAATAGLFLTASPGDGAPAVVGSGTAAAVHLLAGPGATSRREGWWVRVGGQWTRHHAQVRVGGQWMRHRAQVRVGGQWRRLSPPPEGEGLEVFDE